ncbi:amino acid adenylation domain-containing protein [Massilia sp. W12]|uniref:non-ribosomal peptide synthetase n=1 Tax=Massilia sp. W12 TaxID=3126507 RepID=UPI0030D50D4B
MSDLNARLANLSPEKRALLMQQLARQAGAKPKHEIVARVRPERIPASFAQQRLWIMDQLDENSSTYNVPDAVWLSGELQIDALQAALSELLRRHEVLRTVIKHDEQGPFQAIEAARPYVLAQHDLRSADLEQARAQALTLVKQAARLPFKLDSGPLFRAALYQVDTRQWLFFLNAHHIVIDGWSYSIVYDELFALYQAFSQGLPNPLPEPTLQYADYTLWQHEYLAPQGPVLQTQLNYWKDKLSGNLPVLELPNDFPRPPRPTFIGDSVRYRFDGAVWRQLQQFAQHEGVTPFMLFAALLSVMLTRHAAQEELVLGMGVANRHRLEVEKLCGFFVNTLPLRIDLSANPGLRELLAAVKRDTLDAYSHQDLPLERLLKELDLERNMSHAPLFQSMLFFQNLPTLDLELPGLHVNPVKDLNAGVARTDLTFFALEIDGTLELYIEFATDLFTRQTVLAMAQRLQALARAALEQPEQPVMLLDMLPEHERERLSHSWNETRHHGLEQGLTHELFLRQAQATPDACAVVCQDKRLTYRELQARALQIASALQGAGAQAGEMIGIYLPRSADMLAAALGVMIAGCAYVPMDPAFPAERLGFMQEDAGLRHIVSNLALRASMPGQAKAVLLEECQGLPAPRAVDCTPQDCAYVIFTSGSTGRPKGVQAPHSAVVNFLRSMAQQPGLQAQDRLCAVTTLSFDIAVLELFLPLSVGACVVLAGADVTGDGQALAALLEAEDCTVMQATPATWRMLLAAGWRPHPGLRMLCGGEAMPADLAHTLLQGGAALWNMYGPTETTVWSACSRLQPDAPINAGRPIANTTLYVVDKHMQLCPIGVPGELLIGGAGVTLGYLHRPELTAEKFIPDHFSAQGAGRLYRTGDLARWRHDGNLEIMGRLDHQIKLRGYRIELGEIEAVLQEVAGVRQAVALCREDQPGNPCIVAYLVGTQALPQEALRAALAKRLPEYMLPAHIVQLEALPLTPNGKIDRRALPAPLLQVSHGKPANAQEETLCAIFAELLGLPAVGVDDDFFRMGGHSLSATQAIARINQSFGAQLGLRALFEAATPAKMAALLLQQQVASVDAAALADMLSQLEGLSEDEIAAMLAAESA